MKERQLSITSLFGLTTDKIVLLGQPPAQDEDMDPDADVGEDSEADEPAATAAIELAGKSPRFKEWLPWDIRNLWQSSNGTVYCASSSGEVVTFSGGKWRAERVVKEGGLNFIAGVSGASGKEDTVIVLGDDEPVAFQRKQGKWVEIELPDQMEMLFSAAGSRADRIYITGDAGLVLWNGKEIEELEIPDDELSGLLVRPDGDLFATGSRTLHHWSEAKQKWFSHKAPVELSIGIAEEKKTILLATEKGVLSWDSKAFTYAAKGFDTNYIARAGETFFALGSEEGLLMESGGRWDKVDVPVSLLPERPHG